MKVADVMTTDVKTCTPETSLAQVAALMRAGRCGVIPVVDAHGRVAGVLTDRDITMALLESARKPINIAAHEVMSRRVHACGPEQGLRAALQAMADFHVRRLPVVSEDGHLRGILSIDDVILHALDVGAPTNVEILGTLRGILAAGRQRQAEPLMSDALGG
jgi:CBS domain-containing protein